VGVFNTRVVVFFLLEISLSQGTLKKHGNSYFCVDKKGDSFSQPKKA